MSIARWIGSLLAPRRRRAPRPRRTPRLVHDLAVVEGMLEHRAPPARARLEAELGKPLLRELERTLGLEGALVPPRRRRGRVRRAA